MDNRRTVGGSMERDLSEQLVTARLHRKSVPPSLAIGIDPYEVMIPLVLEDVVEKPTTKASTVGTQSKKVAPVWLSRVQPLERNIELILDAVEDLHKLQTRKFLGLDFFLQDNGDDVIQKSNAINELIRTAKTDIRQLGALEQMSPQNKHMCLNIQTLLSLRLAEIHSKFARQQLRYKAELTSADKASSSQNGFHHDQKEDEDISSYDLGFSVSQTQRAQENRAKIAQRTKEIQELATQMEQLQELFQDVSTMVHNQGGMLDRIDYNIEQADADLTVIKKDILPDVVRKEKSYYSTRLCCVLLLVLTIGAIVTLLILTRS